MVHNSITSGFAIPRGCCSVFSATPRPLVHNLATSHYHLPHPVTHHGLPPASCAFPLSLGCCAALATLPSRSRSLFPSLIPCLYPGGPPATLWRGPPGCSSIRGPFRAPCTGRSLPGPFCLAGLFPLGPVCGPFFLAPPPLPPVRVPILHLVTCGFAFRRSLPAVPHLHRLLLPVPPLPARPVLSALRRCIVVFFCGLPPHLSRNVSCLVVSCPCRVCWFFFHPPPCMHARQHCTAHGVTAPLGVRLWSPRPRGACPLAVPGQARWVPLLCVTHLSSLSSLPSTPLPVTCLSPALLLLLSCSVGSPLPLSSPGLYVARSHTPLGLCPVLCPVGRLWPPPQVPFRGDSPVVRSRRPPLHQFPDGGAGRPVRLNAGYRHGVYLSETRCTLVPLLAPCVCFLRARPCASGSHAFSPGCLPCRARCCPRAPCVSPLLTSALPLPRRPVPPPAVPPSHLYSAPTRCHSEGRCLPPPVCTFLSAVIPFAVHSPLFSTRGFHLCPTPVSLPFPLESGCSLTLSTLECYRAQALCYPRDPDSHPYRDAIGICRLECGHLCGWVR